ncbi:MAG TPA: DNA polymerase III subunit delta [Pyrinomonadaceae bacterium]|nr:DNA polymerase III subunit delta [Pyrinomonadaceae bacterium]
MNILSREDLRSHLRQKKIAPLYLLFGEETYLRDLAAKTIADFVLADSSLREFNETAFSLNETQIQYALGSAEQLPMVSSRRVVKIEDVRVSASSNKDNLKEDDEQILASYLTRPSETSVVIFVADELDKRRKIAKLLIENCVAVEFKSLTDFELKKWANDKLKDLDTRIEDRALNNLAALIGKNVRRLTTEVEKLAAAALPDKLITAELVESLVPNSQELSNFDLTDYLLAGNKSRTLETMNKILDDGAEPLMLLGLIANNYHRLFLAKELMNQGVERREVARIMKLPPFKQEEFLATARRADAEKLSRILRKIAKTDLAIKTSKGTPRLQIEMLVCELAGI